MVFAIYKDLTWEKHFSDATSHETAANNENQVIPPAEEPGSSRSVSLDEPRSLASRTRRLVSQSTFQEGELDNAVLNSQQQFINEEDIENSTDEEDPDQLFDEYMRETSETVRSQTQMFDSELPMEHSYLGSNMTSVRGTNYYEPGKVYEIPLCDHHSLVFPGEIFPMIVIADSVFARNPESSEGLTFGLVFTNDIQDKKVYGVTCQVFEKGVDRNGHITVKSKAHQRFELVETDDRFDGTRYHSYIAKVKILPEVFLPDPIDMTLSNHQRKFLQSTQSHKFKNFLASSTRWPKFVYDLYSIDIVNQKIERYLSILNISAPDDPTQRSFWLARNVPLNLSDRIKIFTSNCVNKRMLLIAESLNFVSIEN